MSSEAGGAAASSASAPPPPRRTPLERTADAAEELYRLRDTFFPRDPVEKAAALRALADDALAVLDSLPPEQRKTPQQRAVYEFLRGKILDVFPDYHKEAEDHLSKAVKLNPSLVDAWLCLGNCIWKKGDLASAMNCFSLALSKGADKKILCQLSMLERSMAQGSEGQAQLVEESIKHAKEAVMLDIRDGNSWYNLGNAYLTSFFVSGSWDHTKLHHSVKAYQNAEKDETTKCNPDLYYNCATADKYLENYERALRGFEAAALKDPGLGADTEVQKIISLLDKLDSAMKGQLRSKRLAPSVSSLSEVNIKSSHKKATIGILSEGLNKTVAVLGKVILLIRHDNIAPIAEATAEADEVGGTEVVEGGARYHLRFLSPSSSSASVPSPTTKTARLPRLLVPPPDLLSEHGVDATGIKEGDRVALLDPYYRILDISWKEQRYQFKSIRVDFPEQILVNEKAPPPHHVVRASIHAHNKP
uniref:Tetratricopeptide repeat protein 5 OB fold domain-containing protein n=1 Tax=Oryza glumipatula TaxID=40148 RepID=A0A0D9Y9B3_9ORYZ